MATHAFIDVRSLIVRSSPTKPVRLHQNRPPIGRRHKLEPDTTAGDKRPTFVDAPVYLVVAPLGLVVIEYQLLNACLHRQLDGLVVRRVSPAAKVVVLFRGV